MAALPTNNKVVNPSCRVGTFAAQVIPHVHYHIVLRQNGRQSEKLEKEIPGNKKPGWKGRFSSG